MAMRWRHTLSLLFTMLPFSASAEERMQVNVLVFAQPDHGVSFELWRPANELLREYPLQRLDFKGIQAEIDARYTDIGLLPSDRLTLAAQRLQENDYRVLVNQSWVQPILAAEESMAVVLTGGQILGSIKELEGYLTVYQSEQRIRLGTHLWLSRPNNDTSGGLTSNQQSVQLSDTRIFNVGELHYIDHPRFGVLVELVPLVDTRDEAQAPDA